jgi:hypothetical protein
MHSWNAIADEPKCSEKDTDISHLVSLKINLLRVNKLTSIYSSIFASPMRSSEPFLSFDFTLNQREEEHISSVVDLVTKGTTTFCSS